MFKKPVCYMSHLPLEHCFCDLYKYIYTYIYIYTPLPGQPPVYIFRNRGITGFKKLYTAIGFLNHVIPLPKYGKLRRFYLEGGQFSLHLGQLE